MTNSSSEKPFLRVLDGEALSPPPIWLMRQAGRYLPEYREIRAKFPTFLDFCYAPKAASEATLQPIRRFGFDAAILFSDILVVPDALGQKVSFEVNEGPRLEPILSEKEFGRLNETIDLKRLAPVFETIERVGAALPATTALIGFCGAPWTVASYMIAGRGTPDQAPARLFAYREPELFQRLIDRLVEASVDYLARQIESGVEAVQIFDSWAGVLPAGEYERWCLAPIRRIVAGVRRRHKDARVIGFPKGIGARLDDFAAQTGVDALGLDSAVDPLWAAQNIRERQGAPGQSRSAGFACRRRRARGRRRAHPRSVQGAAAYLQSRPWRRAADAPCACRGVDEARARAGRLMNGGYLWIKAAHIVSVIAWMAGMLYLPRLFVYHASAESGSELATTFATMERRLLRFIMLPAIIATWITGLTLAFAGGFFTAGWLHGKLALVILMSALHGYFSAAQKKLAAGTNLKSARFFRILNEAPTILLIGIVFLVVIKPF